VAAGLLDLPALGDNAPRLLYAYPAFFIAMGTGVLMAAALGRHAARVPAQRQPYLPVDEPFRLPVQAARELRGGERPEECRERAH
jgi:hypothetical protein